jgi:hypothetical protein
VEEDLIGSPQVLPSDLKGSIWKDVQLYNHKHTTIPCDCCLFLGVGDAFFYQSNQDNNLRVYCLEEPKSTSQHIISPIEVVTTFIIFNFLIV